MISHRILFTTFFLFISVFVFSQTDNSLQQGNDYFENLNYSKAKQAYGKSWDKNQNSEALWGLANSSFELGNQLQFNGKTAEAQKKYAEALTSAEKLVTLDPNNPDFLLFRGLMYLYNYRAETANLDFMEAQTKFPSSGRAYYYLWTQLAIDPSSKVEHEYVEKAFELNPNLFELHQELGAYYTNLNQSEKAIYHYNQALELSPKNYKAHFALGQIYWAMGDLTQMRVHFTESLNYFPDFGYAKMLLAGVELMSDNLSEAVPLIREALKDNPATEQYLNMYIQNYPELSNHNFKEVNDESPLDANGYPKFYMQGVTLAQNFDFYGAIDLLLQCKENYDQYALAQPAWKASILSWLTHCYRELGNYGEAVRSAKQALDLAVKHNLTTDQASLAANLSMIYYTWGDYPKTLQYARESLSFLIANNQNAQLYDAYINLGSYYRKWGQSDSAIYFNKKALQQLYDPSDLKFVLAQKELALSLLSANKLDSARLVSESMNRTRETYSFPDQEAALDFGSAEVFYTLGEYDLAWNYITKAFNHFSQLEEIAPNHPSIIPFLEKYVGLAVKMGYADLANSNYQALNYKLINQISNYFSSMSENGKLLFYREAKQHFESFNSFAMAQPNLDQPLLNQLLENQLLLKGLLFNDAAKIQTSISKSDDKELKETFQNLLDKKNLLARCISLTNEEKIARKLDTNTLQKQIDSLQIQLMNRGISSGSIYEPQLVNKVKKSLGPREAAIEIVRYRTFDYNNGGVFTKKVNYLALIIKGNKDEISHVHLDNGNELESKIYSAYSNAINYELEDKQSYDALWKPIAEKLDNIDRVYLSGDGVYHKINVNTLLNPVTEQFVIDELDLRLVTSTRDLLKSNTPLPSRGEILLVGFPTYQMGSSPTSYLGYNQNTVATRAFTNIENLEPLPGTYSEVTTIESIFEKSKWKTTVLTGDDALEEKIKNLDKTTILHIATHGYFEENSSKDNPLFYSGLFLSGASSNYQNNTNNGEDGILTAYEAMHLNLNETQMVVLSACETGMGHIENGEGVYGLQRAFLIAGSKSVVMSFWKVNDQTTMDLMVNFYQNLNTTKYKHGAFRNAQLQLKQRHTNPKYWGAFNIVGR